MAAPKKNFRAYLKRAVALALKDEREKNDDGNLQWFWELARRGVRRKWSDLTPAGFLEQYLWCVGSIQKKYWVHLQHFPEQMALLRQCNAAEIVCDAADIRVEWSTNKRDLNTRMLEAVIGTAAK